MLKKYITILMLAIGFLSTISFKKNAVAGYKDLYFKNLNAFDEEQQKLLALIVMEDLANINFKKNIIAQIEVCRRKLKGIDFWLRYFEPNNYKKINGPLPVEWETEVFEKFEKPYRRQGAGLTIAEMYLNEDSLVKDSLLSLIQTSINATEGYNADSITNNLKTPDAFFLSNRLYLLNLATIYSTGFETPNRERIIPEMQNMLVDVNEIYQAFNLSFPDYTLSNAYLTLYNQTISFVKSQPKEYTKFDHFTFIKNYINPLFSLNQQHIISYHILSKSNLDFTLNNKANSIFEKSLFFAQNTKGIYSRIKDSAILKEIEAVGKLLFYDPILSGNNLRSCVSCHKSTGFFTDTTVQTALQYNKTERLQRNTPSLLNAPFNHLIMLDGKLPSLQQQGKTVISNAIEMGSNHEELIDKILSCPDYKKTFKNILTYTPAEKEINIGHIVSALTLYYGKFSKYDAPFDEAMNKNEAINKDAIKGFNLFMSKAQCATCHFLPSFSGIKPPYIGNEFEVIGVPSDASYKAISEDKGRYNVNPAYETLHAFRTLTLRNAE